MSDLHQIVCVLPMAVAESSSGGIAICYVVPVLWMTPYLHISIVARNRQRGIVTQRGQQDLTPRRILKLTHQGAAPDVRTAGGV